MIKEVSPLTLSSMIASDGQMILFYLPHDHDFYYSLSKLESETSRLVFWRKQTIRVPRVVPTAFILPTEVRSLGDHPTLPERLPEAFLCSRSCWARLFLPVALLAFALVSFYFLFIYFWLECSWFRMLCLFLLHHKVLQLHIYMHSSSHSSPLWFVIGYWR